MAGALNEIGLADAVIARKTPEGFELIDGHLRQEVLGDTPVPVLVVDLTEAEADKLLLTLDPIAAMATTDTDALLGLLEQAEIDNSALNDMLEALANGERHPMPDWSQYEPPAQDDIEARAETMEGQFVTAQEQKALKDPVFDVICPDCGSEFQVGMINDNDLKRGIEHRENLE